jgi:hypothetical protein
MRGNAADGGTDPDLMHVGQRVYFAFKQGRDTLEIAQLIGIPECLAERALSRMQDLKHGYVEGAKY